MLSPVAILMALSFWAPYNGGVAPCGGSADGVKVHYFAPGKGAIQNTAAYAYIGDSCAIYVRRDLAKSPRYVQCAYVAHEIGHSVFGLGHSGDPMNVMYVGRFVIPGKCFTGREHDLRAPTRPHPQPWRKA